MSRKDKRKKRTYYKEKSIVLILVFLLGPLGVHRMYLGQYKRGFLYMILTITFISFILSFIDFFYFLFMNQEKFDLKYNHIIPEHIGDRTSRTISKQQLLSKRADTADARDLKVLKIKAKELFKDYHIEEAAKIYQDIIEDKPDDIVSHFNLACCYSILERKQEVYEHLEKAVLLGFNDYSKIFEQESLAFIRLDEDWNNFVSRGFRRQVNSEIVESSNIIKELKRITELRDRGIIDDLQYQRSKVELIRK